MDRALGYEPRFCAGSNPIRSMINLTSFITIKEREINNMKNEKRMPKGWTHVSTNTNFVKAETRMKRQDVNKVIKNIKSKSYEDLQKEANEAYMAAETRKTNLLQAYEDKKLKSKALIKEAKAIKKERDKINK